MSDDGQQKESQKRKRVSSEADEGKESDPKQDLDKEESQTTVESTKKHGLLSSVENDAPKPQRKRLKKITSNKRREIPMKDGTLEGTKLEVGESEISNLSEVLQSDHSKGSVLEESTRNYILKKDHSSIACATSSTVNESVQKSKKIFFVKPKQYKLSPKPGHPIDWKKLHQFDPEVIGVLKNQKPYTLEHYIEEERTTPSSTSSSSAVTTAKNNFVDRVLRPDAPCSPYVRRRFELKKSLHWGQLKLFLTEIEFLSLALLQRNKDKKEHLPIHFVYAGAAPGEHTAYLSKLFPMIQFHLYDPNKFKISESDSVRIYQQFFTEVDAQQWQGKEEEAYIIFASDVRTEPATEETVKENMEMQLDWWKDMNPEIAMFKFRLPWQEGETEYAAGDIYIQPYPGATSTESRLIVPKGSPMIKYDHKKYEEQCFHHNTVTRTRKYQTVLGNSLKITTDGICNCYDCASFVSILDTYLDAIRWAGDSHNRCSEIRRLVREVQDNTTNKHNIYVQTVRNMNFQMDHFERYAYKSCGNQTCTICGTLRETGDDDVSKISSSEKYGIETNATNENLHEAIKRAKSNESCKESVDTKYNQKRKDI